jgi:hypothetical protein
VKFPLEDIRSPDGAAVRPFKLGAKGHLHSVAPPHVRPRAVEAEVWRIDPDGVVFRFTGPSIAPPPLEAGPRARQVRLSGSWMWAWKTSETGSQQSTK